MLADFIPLMAALVIAAAIYVLRERYRRRTRVNPARPDLRLAEITPEELPEPQDLQELRRQILHHATVTLYLEAVLELQRCEPGIEPLLREEIVRGTTRWQALREYGRLKYDDLAPEDWFEHYRAIAAPYIHEKVNAARESQTTLVEIYTELLRDLQSRLLGSPPKKRYAPPDLVAAQPNQPNRHG
jgi:hypothetical protein